MSVGERFLQSRKRPLHTPQTGTAELLLRVSFVWCQTPVPQEGQLAKGCRAAALPGSPLSSSFQIEFVTGTKKGTTTNATATTTTTASTAVAGRRQLSASSDGARVSLPYVGE